MTTKLRRILRPDSKGRITLGEFAKGVSSYRCVRNHDGDIWLIPMAEVDAPTEAKAS